MCLHRAERNDLSDYTTLYTVVLNLGVVMPLMPVFNAALKSSAIDDETAVGEYFA